ncbi:MAG: DNA topoisomerase 4 subunit A [Oscillatoriales cyanobacterium]|nr:MAG: DNA topoisomerase 4 subunit A [Oscillatoriales cyanobacterium]
MTAQLNFLGSGQTIPTSLHGEMQRSYLEYAMSTIVGRALPDARDGLKPVHRRILYAMHELGLTPDRPFRKCARVVGDVLGKYHPHGDKAVYDALVRMVQSFSMRYPLLQGHGNFGSIDDDPPAAMRYTETRLAAIAQSSALANLSEATVDFAANFDSSQQEPVVLPVQLPLLLLNGCSGIAVGMATNIPPHHLGELVDGLVTLIDRPELTDEQLWQLIPGPDFPTGGEIVGTKGIEDAYRTGKGSITLRGIAHVEEIPGSRGRQKRTAIVVTELPYQTNKSSWLEKMAELVNLGKLTGISDLRDESDRDGIRVVIELKREADPADVLKHLYRQTDLQSTFGVILLAIVDRQPRQLSLKQALQVFLDFREETLTRQLAADRTEVADRLELVEGLVLALDNLDATIEILRFAPDGSTAQAQLAVRLGMTDNQAHAVLGMPMRRLTGMERQKLLDEREELRSRLAALSNLLADRTERLKFLKKDLRSLKKHFGDQRRTRILPESDWQAEQAATPLAARVKASEPAIIELSDRGYVRRVAPKRRRSEPALGELAEREEASVQTFTTQTDRELLVLTRSGKAYSLRVGDIPQVSKKNPRGVPLVTLLPESARSTALQSADDGTDSVSALAREIVAVLSLDFGDRPNPPTDLILLTQQGRLKRLSLSEFERITGRGLVTLKLKEGDELGAVALGREGDRLVIAASSGRAVVLSLTEPTLPISTRSSPGLVATKLGRSEQLVGCCAVEAGQPLALISERAYGKSLSLGRLRLSKPGESGANLVTLARGDRLAAIAPVPDRGCWWIVTNQGRSGGLSWDQFPLLGREDQGDRLVKLASTEAIVTATALGSGG